MKTGIIIQARINSSSTRLPEKVTLPIGKYSCLHWCVLRCQKMKETAEAGTPIDKIIIATTFEKEDLKIKSMYQGSDIVNSVYRGSTEDLVMRYYGAAQTYGIDTIVRITGDCPVFSHEIGNILLQSHLETGADYTEAKKAAIGTGCQIWKFKTFAKLLEMGVNHKFSEHMSFFVTSNPEIFKVNLVELPPEHVRDYRLTLDYQDDWYMLKDLFWEVMDKNPKCNENDIFSIKDVFACLDSRTSISKINAHCQQIFDTEFMQAELKKENDRIRRK